MWENLQEIYDSARKKIGPKTAGFISSLPNTLYVSSFNGAVYDSKQMIYAGVLQFFQNLLTNTFMAKLSMDLANRYENKYLSYAVSTLVTTGIGFAINYLTHLSRGNDKALSTAASVAALNLVVLPFWSHFKREENDEVRREKYSRYSREHTYGETERQRVYDRCRK